MAFDLMIKDLSEIQSRLYDHRPVLQGDVLYFFKEFEEKRGHRDFTTLQKCNEEVSLMQDLYLPGCLQQAEICLTDIASKTNTATQICDRICTKKHPQTDYLIECRQQRSKEWTDFMTEQCRRSAEVDRMYATELNKIKSAPS
ncbi:biogenesis of lysosome-related organelles complex 1 subunit 5-like [Argonauta hians]